MLGSWSWLDVEAKQSRMTCLRIHNIGVSKIAEAFANHLDANFFMRNCVEHAENRLKRTVYVGANNEIEQNLSICVGFRFWRFSRTNDRRFFARGARIILVGCA